MDSEGSDMEILAEAVKLFIGNKEILKGLDLHLKPKEFLGIIGPNGSGKSMFLKCLYRVQKPTAGTITLNGHTLDEMSYRESAQQISVVAQHNFYSFDFSVLDVVLMGRSPHKRLFDRDNADDYAIAHRSLRTVGMDDCAERSFSSLSGGEQQRVILARALTQEAECMILDEPTNHLDIKYQLQIMDIVKRLDLTVVAAIHDLNIAALYCDRLIAIQKGRIVGAGTPRELLTEAFIHDLYEVCAKVEEGEDGRIYIRYVPQYGIKS